MFPLTKVICRDRLAAAPRASSTPLGVDREPLTEPPVSDGYSVARRALAGLLGVRLAERSQRTLPIFGARNDSMDVSTSPEPHQDRRAIDGDTITATDEPLQARQSGETATANDARSRQIALAEQIIAPRESVQAAAAAKPPAADPKMRLALRKHPVIELVIISDLMTRAIAVAKIISFRLWDYPSAMSYRMNALAYASDLARDLDLARGRNHGRDHIHHLDHARDRARDRALDLNLAATSPAPLTATSSTASPSTWPSPSPSPATAP